MNLESLHVEKGLEGDNQVPQSESVYNYLPFLEILCQKCPEVSIAIGETVLPTYTYARVYKNGATLEGHTDRDEVRNFINS